MKKNLKINNTPLKGQALKRYQKRIAELEKELEPVVKAIKDSQRITSEDLAKRINI